MLAGIALGIVLGFVAPERAVMMGPLGDGFIKFVKMLIAPVVFTTVVVGIAQMGEMKAGLRLLLGVDRFMSEARAITNLIGNAVATMAIARWDGALDLDRARRVLDGRPAQDVQVEAVMVTYVQGG